MDGPIWSVTAPFASTGSQTLFTVTWPWRRVFVITHDTLSPYATAKVCVVACAPPFPVSHAIEEPYFERSVEPSPASSPTVSEPVGATWTNPVVPPSPALSARVTPPTWRSKRPGSLAGSRSFVTLTCGSSLFVTTHVTGAVMFASATGPVYATSAAEPQWTNAS